MAEERKPCRCLLAESGQKDMARLVLEYIDALPDGDRADEALRSQRLNACKACSSLQNGTCALCGCYVEARTAKQRQKCPAVPPKWE